MELTPEVIATVERTIADRLSIYRGGPYTVRCDLDSRGLQIGVEGLVDYHRVGYAWAILRHEIEACDEATFAGLVQVCAERRFERPLVEYLRNHPAPRTLPNRSTVNFDIGPITFSGESWMNFGDVVSRSMTRTIERQHDQLVTATIDSDECDRCHGDGFEGCMCEIDTPEPERVSRYQLLAAEWLS